MRDYEQLKNPIRYYVVLNAENEVVSEGNFYEILHELNWKSMDFYNAMRVPQLKRKANKSAYRLVELLPDESKDEFRAYYDCLVRIKDYKIKPSIVKEVAKACINNGYHEVLNKSKNNLIGIVSYESPSIARSSRVMAKNLVLITYALLSISEDLTLEELVDYYHVPLWLAEIIDCNYYEVFVEKSIVRV